MHSFNHSNPLIQLNSNFQFDDEILQLVSGITSRSDKEISSEVGGSSLRSGMQSE